MGCRSRWWVYHAKRHQMNSRWKQTNEYTKRKPAHSISATEFAFEFEIKCKRIWNKCGINSFSLKFGLQCNFSHFNVIFWLFGIRSTAQLCVTLYSSGSRIGKMKVAHVHWVDIDMMLFSVWPAAPTDERIWTAVSHIHSIPYDSVFLSFALNSIPNRTQTRNNAAMSFTIVQSTDSPLLELLGASLVSHLLVYDTTHAIPHFYFFLIRAPCRFSATWYSCDELTSIHWAEYQRARLIGGGDATIPFSDDDEPYITHS